MLTPARDIKLPRERDTQGEDFRDSVQYQTTLGRIVDVGFDHKGIGTNLLSRFWIEGVAFADNQVIDLLDRFWFQKKKCVLDPSPDGSCHPRGG